MNDDLFINNVLNPKVQGHAASFFKFAPKRPFYHYTKYEIKKDNEIINILDQILENQALLLTHFPNLSLNNN